MFYTTHIIQESFSFSLLVVCMFMRFLKVLFQVHIASATEYFLVAAVCFTTCISVIISSLTSHLTQAAVAMTSDMTQLEVAAKILLVPHAIIATSAGSYAYQHNCRLEIRC